MRITQHLHISHFNWRRGLYTGNELFNSGVGQIQVGACQCRNINSRLANFLAKCCWKNIKREGYFKQQMTIVDLGKCLKVLVGLPCEITRF